MRSFVDAWSAFRQQLMGGSRMGLFRFVTVVALWSNRIAEE